MRALLLGLLLLGAPHLALVFGAEPVQVFILAGQSNASGRASAGSTYPGASAADATVRYFYDTDTTGSFSEIRTSSGAFETLHSNNGRFGPEMGIGRTLAGAGIGPVVIIKFSRGGTNLYNDWDPEATSGHLLYDGLVSRVNTALTVLGNQGLSYELAGFFWMQGESDGPQAANYQANLTEFISSVRSDLGAPELEFVIGRVGTTVTGTDREVIRTAQVAVADSDPNATWIDVDDLTRFDGTHYDASGAMTLGARFAESYLTSIPEPAHSGLLLAGILAVVYGRRFFR